MINTFDETTGECIAACGGDSIDGHRETCPMLAIESRLRAAERLAEAAGKFMEDQGMNSWTTPDDFIAVFHIRVGDIRRLTDALAAWNKQE